MRTNSYRKNSWLLTTLPPLLILHAHILISPHSQSGAVHQHATHAQHFISASLHQTCLTAPTSPLPSHTRAYLSR